ncbi:MAG: CoA-binding protein, partial [Candidatus Hodarchaeota archaeon]
YHSIFKVKQEVDLVLVIVPASVVPEIIEKCIAANAKAIIIISAGFSESILYDQTGIKLQNEIKKLIRNSKVRIVGPNCNGIYNLDCSLNATLGPRIILPPGNLSMVTRGGTAGILLGVAAARKNIGVNKYIGIGDESDLTIQDFIHYFDYDQNTKIIGAYTEGIQNVKEFRKIINSIKKPLIIYKSGETKTGSHVAISHIGAIAGEFTSKIFEGLLKQLKVVRAEEIEDFMDFIAALSISPLPKGKKVGIWTPGGSMGVMMADYIEKEGLIIPKLHDQQIKKLNQILKVKYWSHGNPVDVTDSFNPQSIDKSAEILLSGENIDGLIILFGFGITENADYIDFSFRKEFDDFINIYLKQQAKKFGKLIKKYQKPIFILAEDRGVAATIFKKEGVIVLPTFQRIARTFKMLYKRYEYLK